MKKMKQALVLSILLCCFFGSGKAQSSIDELPLYYVVGKDRNIYYGKIVERTKRTILLETESIGTVRMRLKKLKYIERFRPELMIDGVYYPKLRFPHHNTFTPTGVIGDSYYQNTFVYWNSFSSNISSKASLSGGLFPVFHRDYEGFTFWLSPKFKIPLKSEKIKMCVGYFGLLRPNGGYLGEVEDVRMGLVYSVVTYGNEFFSVSGGLGTGMGAKKFYKWPFYTMNASIRVKNRSFFRLEILGGGDFGSFSDISYRIQARKTTFDLGWIFTANKERFGSGLFGGPYFSMLFKRKEY